MSPPPFIRGRVREGESQHVAEAPYDANRDAFLRSHGFRVLRFWNGDVMMHVDSVVETISEALYRPEMDGRFD